MDNVLHMIGLANRARQVAVGEEPVGAAARARDARLILLARDAAENSYRRAQHFADAGQCIWLSTPYTKAELGQVTGCSSCAMLAVTEIGLASAIVSKLAAADPEKYEQSAQRMEIKKQRIMQRRQEQRQHEKNLRQGKRKKASPEPAAAAPEKSEQKAVPGKHAPAAKRPYRSRERKKDFETAPRRFENSRPVTKGKGSFRKKSESGK